MPSIKHGFHRFTASIGFLCKSSFVPAMDGADDGSVEAVRISTEVMVAAVAFLFMVVVFAFFLYLYARHRLRSNGVRFVFSASADVGRRGLDAAALAALPTTVYRSADFKEAGGLECAVCLTELSEGETARVLPACGHGFHLECIDMWFHSHATCPLCRRPVAGEPSSPITEPQNPLPPPLPLPEASPREPPSFPTNVLFWGGQGQEGALVIEIPRRAVDGSGPQVSPSPTTSASEELRSPVSARFRSLRRLWSQGRRTGAGPSTTDVVDVEQGMAEGRAPPPKTPTAKP
ncbi:E3 ubiquitin-protein ligase EL5-like [Zingiber officinale]|uniref:RING-type E3 ubiquitin transferase n=1 Tax=Zingiber officinale TaxID=94328 RepID=A0A8J5FZW9_ZINOF|nr:E3 ubiquitin-protein ligase EL5-like [Zingiber officinale]KAG6493497.1 hypothetical protein ZIOFF_048484 [Zingiber officinale]